MQARGEGMPGRLTWALRSADLGGSISLSIWRPLKAVRVWFWGIGSARGVNVLADFFKSVLGNLFIHVAHDWSCQKDRPERHQDASLKSDGEHLVEYFFKPERPCLKVFFKIYGGMLPFINVAAPVFEVNDQRKEQAKRYVDI
jgi:hypothetical protein